MKKSSYVIKRRRRAIRTAASFAAILESIYSGDNVPLASPSTSIEISSTLTLNSFASSKLGILKLALSVPFSMPASAAPCILAAAIFILQYKYWRLFTVQLLQACVRGMAFDREECQRKTISTIPELCAEILEFNTQENIRTFLYRSGQSSCKGNNFVAPKNEFAPQKQRKCGVGHAGINPFLTAQSLRTQYKRDIFHIS